MGDSNEIAVDRAKKAGNIKAGFLSLKNVTNKMQPVVQERC